MSPPAQSLSIMCLPPAAGGRGHRWRSVPSFNHLLSKLCNRHFHSCEELEVLLYLLESYGIHLLQAGKAMGGASYPLSSPFTALQSLLPKVLKD